MWGGIMNIAKNYYVIMKVGNMDINNETVYVTDNDCSKFTNDIISATKFADRFTALVCKQDYDLHENHSYESDMQIIPVKITYEW